MWFSFSPKLCLHFFKFSLCSELSHLLLLILSLFSLVPHSFVFIMIQLLIHQAALKHHNHLSNSWRKEQSKALSWDSIIELPAKTHLIQHHQAGHEGDLLHLQFIHGDLAWVILPSVIGGGSLRGGKRKRQNSHTGRKPHPCSFSLCFPQSLSSCHLR